MKNELKIELREINMENFQECIRLSVAESQRKFVASNMYSLAEAKADGASNPLAIYYEDQMVGFTMYCYESDSKLGYIDRLMVGAEYQGQGYGRAAMIEVIARLQNTPGCERIRTSYEPTNEVAAGLYKSLGFQKTCEIDAGEVVVVLDCSG